MVLLTNGIIFKSDTIDSSTKNQFGIMLIVVISLLVAMLLVRILMVVAPVCLQCINGKKNSPLTVQSFNTPADQKKSRVRITSIAGDTENRNSIVGGETGEGIHQTETGPKQEQASVQMENTTA
jgi:hypothetical protein